MGKIRKEIKISRVITRVVLSLAIIGAGIFAMSYFKSTTPQGKGKRAYSPGGS